MAIPQQLIDAAQAFDANQAATANAIVRVEAMRRRRGVTFPGGFVAALTGLDDADLVKAGKWLQTRAESLASAEAAAAAAADLEIEP